MSKGRAGSHAQVVALRRRQRRVIAGVIYGLLAVTTLVWWLADFSGLAYLLAVEALAVVIGHGWLIYQGARGRQPTG